MDMYSSIFNRKSTRKFDAEPLSAQTMRDFKAFVAGIKPLLPDVTLSHKIVGADEDVYKRQAIYLSISSELLVL